VAGDRYEETREQAQAAFLGHHPVAGVGLMEEDGTIKLAFLLEMRSVIVEAEILEWARDHRIDVTFVTTTANQI
jgi:hypothetical protein